MQKITEEMKIHEEWFKEAKNMTLDKLPDFLKKLTEEYSHDYGTICHAIVAGALATCWAMNNIKQGGITGFQAGCIMWGFIREWNYSSNKTGLKLLDYDNFLYPQYAYKFDKVIDVKTWERIQNEAKKKIEELNIDEGSPVYLHWKSIVNGVVPFGFKVNEED